MSNNKEGEDAMAAMREFGRIEGENKQLRARIAELEAQQRAGVSEGITVSRACIYKLNDHGYNEWFAQVQPGVKSDGTRLTQKECEHIALMLAGQAPAPEAKEQAEHKLSAAGVFKGAEGLRDLLDAQDFWDQQPYGTRLYFGEMANEYLHRDVLRAAVALLDQRQEQAPQPAEVGAGGREELERALTDLCDEIDKHTVHTPISATNIAWFKRKAREALAAYRKGGGA